MKIYKRDWGDATTLNFLMFWPLSVLRLPAHASSLRPTFDAPCLRFFTSGLAMYIPQHFDEPQVEVLHALMCACPLATLVAHAYGSLCVGMIALETGRLR